MTALKRLPILAAVVIFAVSVQAVDIISVNFVDDETAPATEALITGTYGVEPAANWNNIFSAASNLTNDSGVATTVGVATVRPNGNALWPDDYTNTVLYAGIRENLPQSPHSSVTFTNLNANFPDGCKVIVYLTGAQDNFASTITDGTDMYYWKTLNVSGNFDGSFTRTLDTAYNGTGASVDVAQYAVFGNEAVPLTSDSITITVDSLLNAAAGIGGVQVVGVVPVVLPDGTVFYDDFGYYTDGDGKVPPTKLNPWDWSVVIGNPWNATAGKYYRNGDGSIFGSTNGFASGNLDAPADSTGGVGAKIGYETHDTNSYEVLTVNTGIKFNVGTNYMFKFRAMVKNKNNDTSGDALAIGQINCVMGYYNAASSNFVSVKSENVTTLTATGWTDIDFISTGSRVETNALGNDIVVRLSRGNFTNTTDYLTWVDYIQIDLYTPVDDWLESYGLTNASWTADADGDKIDNFTEFATGGNPNDPGSIGFIGPSFIVDIGGGTNRLAYITPRQVDYWVNGVDYSLQRTTDLVIDPWVGAGTWIKGVDGQGFSAEFDAVTNFLGNIDSNEKQFLRLKVSHPNYNP